MSRIPFRTLASLLLLVGLALGLGGCVVAVDGTSGSTGAFGRGTEVRLYVEAEGRGATVRAIRYRVGGEAQSVGDPTLPWRMRLPGAAGDAIFIRSTASAPEGSRVTLRYEVLRSGRVVARDALTCEEVGCPAFQLVGEVPE